MALGKEKNYKEPVDPWTTDESTWQYVTIPDEDPLGKEYCKVSLNKHVFEAGQTYKVPPQVADYVRDRVKVYNRSCVRLLQPNRDIVSERQVAFGSSSASQIGAQAVDASNISTL
jgi:hypothetical protein